MKKLKLKIQDLENPSILTHREIKNILGGDAGGSDDVHGFHTCIVHNFGLEDVPYEGLTLGQCEDLKRNCPAMDGCISVECD